MDPFDEVNKLIIMPGGKLPTKLNSVMSTLGLKYSINIPTATEVRKALATIAVKESSPRTQALLTQQMSHSVDVHKKNYEQLKTGEHAAEAYRAVQTIVTKTNDGNQRFRNKRTPFSADEVEEITTFFKENIDTGEPPRMDACKEFLDQFPNPHGRTTKDIYDKVRNIIRKS